MTSLGISTDPNLLSVGIPQSLTASPSVSTFLPDEEASIRPLLPTTPSPPLMNFINPLTNATIGNGNLSELQSDDPHADSCSSGSSSGIGIQVNGGTTNLFNNNAYHHLGKNGDLILQENGVKSKQNALNLQKTKGAPSFVTWNWPIIRKCTFFVFMAILLAMVGIIVAKIVSLPKLCNPRIKWYRGSVFYEIFPASFQDSNNDGLGDLKGITSRADYFENLGVSAIRLNSIFPTKHTYPEHYQNISTITEIAGVLGTKSDLLQLSKTLHSRNISLILDLPIYPLFKKLNPASLNLNETTSNGTEKYISKDFERVVRGIDSENNLITTAIQMWLSFGIDGFYIKGLEYFINDPYFVENIKEWKHVLGKDRILIISNDAYDILHEIEKIVLKPHIDLIDVFLDVSNGTEFIAKQIKSQLENEVCTGGKGNNPWIHWTLGGVSEKRLSIGLTSNATLASTLMQLMLPGTPSIFYGDEISLQEVHDPLGEHSENKHLHHLSAMAWSRGAQFTNRESLPWLPRGASASFNHFDYVANLIALRKISPSIYKNSVVRDSVIDINTAVRYSPKDIFILERWYPRRNTFIAISNFSNLKISLDLSSLFYSGMIMLGTATGNQIFFSNFDIGPMETLIVKLDK